MITILNDAYLPHLSTPHLMTLIVDAKEMIENFGEERMELGL